MVMCSVLAFVLIFLQTKSLMNNGTITTDF
nr:MAG TPA_asm: hypothetical protein [Caudoviricetes sp.]